METNSIGSDGTDELLTSLDPLLDQSTQLVLESSREDKSFVSTFRSSSRQETVLTNDSKSSDGRQSKLFDADSPRFDPRHASVAEILERTDRQLKALSAARKSNFDNPPEALCDQRQAGRKSASLSRADSAGVLSSKGRRSENWSAAAQQDIVISRPLSTRTNGLKEAMDWNNRPPLPPPPPPNELDMVLRQRLFESERKLSDREAELEELREKCLRKDNLLQQLDKNFADVVLKTKEREGEKDETIVELRGRLAASEDLVVQSRGELARLQATAGDTEQRLRQKEEATAVLMSESREALRRSAEEVKRLRDELEIESRGKSELLRRNQAMHEENSKMAKSLAAMEKAFEGSRSDFCAKEREQQAKVDKHVLQERQLNEVARQQEAVIGDLQRALRMAQAELERWKSREREWGEERKATAAQSESAKVEFELGLKRCEQEMRAKNEKERAEDRAASEAARTQVEQRLRESHRDEIHALCARQQKELGQVRERAEQELARRLAAVEDTVRDLRSELAGARERAEYYRLKSCEAEAQRLRTLTQMQALMQASCSQALNVLNKSTASATATAVEAPAMHEAFGGELRTVLEPVPELEPGDGLDIIDSLVARGSRPPSSLDLINLGGVSPAPSSGR